MNNFNEKYGNRKLINRGQWADTYKAVNSIIKDVVTLNVIINNINDTEYIDNLKKEVKILKDMENPNLICINTMGSIVGEENTYHYIESESFPGISLKEKLQSGKLNGVEAIKILRQVAEGLKEFHFKGLVYNKLSCDNIYIDEKGTVKVDTLVYLEEKCLNISSKEEFSEEIDIYSLGAVLFELTTGKEYSNSVKCKNEISDEDLICIIYKCTNKKSSMYEDLNQFIKDANAYLEYGGESTGVVSEETVDEENDEEYDEHYDEDYEVEIKKNSYKKPLLLMTGLAGCLLVFLIVATTINGGSLFNNKKNNIENTSTKSPVATEPKEETPKEEIQEEEAVLEEEVLVDEPTSDEDTTYSQPVYNNTDNRNNTSKDYYPNNNNNNRNHNTGNNNGGGQYAGDDSQEETPTPDQTPDPDPVPDQDSDQDSDQDPTPDSTPDSGNDDAKLETETE